MRLMVSRHIICLHSRLGGLVSHVWRLRLGKGLGHRNDHGSMGVTFSIKKYIYILENAPNGVLQLLYIQVTAKNKDNTHINCLNRLLGYHETPDQLQCTLA